MRRNFKLIISILLFLICSGVYSLFADGFIVVTPPHNFRPVHHYNPFPLSVKYHHVDVKISDSISLTEIDQVFFNSTRRRLEGYYMFPVPEGAVIKNFSMYINGRETIAELLDAKKARRIYMDIVRKMKDPALLEYSGKRLFKVRIYPIEPMSEKRIKIAYTEVLKKDGRTLEYVYPLNTEKFSSKLIKSVSIRVNMDASERIGNIYCPTHKTEIIRKGDRKVIVGFEASNIKPDRDFKLYFDYGKSGMNFSLKTFKKDGEDGFFFLNITPAFKIKKNSILPKDIVFALDVSGSMSGKKIEQAKRALKFCINNLRKRDRFNVIKFSTEAEPLFEDSVSAKSRNKKKAVEFVDGLRAVGGTNIFEALEIALKNSGKSFLQRTVVFITDGKPTIGVTSENQLIKRVEKKNTGKIRIFTFGIGNDINTHLLDKLTALTGAYRSYITPDEDIEIKISRFFTKIESPVLTDLSLKVDSPVRIRKIYPKKFPDLFKGSSLSLIGRFSGNGLTKITLRGMVADHQKSFVFSCNFNRENSSADYIPKLWAARRVGFLLDQIRLNGENNELKSEVIRVARKYGVVTPYTSYLIVEDEKKAVGRRLIKEEDRLLNPSVFSVNKFKKEADRDHISLRMKSGELSVRASREVQRMYSASNYSQIDQGVKRIPLKNQGNSVSDIGSVVKSVEGRAFYNRGDSWVDSLIRIRRNLKIVRVKFFSDKYFKLLKNYPSISKFFFLGKNVKFVFNNIIYKISE